MSDILTPEQTAKHLKISLGYLYRLAQKKKIPYVKIGNRKAIRFRKSEVDKWFDDKGVQPITE